MDGLIKIAKRIKYRLEGRYRPSSQYDCQAELIGTDYGGYSICPSALPPEPIVYSFGIGKDISFDTTLIDNYHAHVFAFDPTPRSAEWLKKQQLPQTFRWFEYGLSHQDGVMTFYPPENPDYVSHSMIHNSTLVSEGISLPVKRFSTIAKDLGHHRVDILKMDIEGSEYEVLPDILSADDVEIGQILIEYHHRFAKDGVEKTKQSIEL
ncbi:MAG: FkbM family methyltransferase [Anaerolineae bacterium]|nr:FkbM family methyltransferase [Anaerolineae bacterium]